MIQIKIGEKNICVSNNLHNLNVSSHPAYIIGGIIHTSHLFVQDVTLHDLSWQIEHVVLRRIRFITYVYKFELVSVFSQMTWSGFGFLQIDLKFTYL